MPANISQSTARRFMLPVDDTPETLAAFQWLVSNLYKPGDVVDIVHVIPNAEGCYGDSGTPAMWVGVYEEFLYPDSIAAENVAAGLAIVQEKFGSVLKESGVCYKVHMLQGHRNASSIADAISKKAVELNAQAIVMAHHKKSMLQTWFLGSVCHVIISKATTPLVILH